MATYFAYAGFFLAGMAIGLLILIVTHPEPKLVFKLAAAVALFSVLFMLNIGYIEWLS